MGTKKLFDEAGFQLNGQQKVALVGRNGIGKSTLLRILIGKDMIDSGDIITLKKLRIGYISQELFWESAHNTLAQEIHMSDMALYDLMLAYQSETHHDPELTDKITQIDGFKRWDLQIEILKYFGFEPEDHSKKISELSGGQQVRAQLAKCLLQDVDVLVLDEPTNHLDIEGIQFLETFCQMW